MRLKICRGGVPSTPFQTFLQYGFAGPGRAIDMVKAIGVRPLYDDFWKSLHVDVTKIPVDLPVYGLASYSTGLHTFGSMRTFREAPSKNKWLRIHRQQEWYVVFRRSELALSPESAHRSDFFRPEIEDELQRCASIPPA